METNNNSNSRAQLRRQLIDDAWENINRWRASYGTPVNMERLNWFLNLGSNPNDSLQPVDIEAELKSLEKYK